MQTMHCTRLIISQYQKRLREQAMNYRVEHPVFSVRHHHVVRVRVETVTRSFCDARLSRTSLMLRAGVSRELYWEIKMITLCKHVLRQYTAEWAARSMSRTLYTLFPREIPEPKGKKEENRSFLIIHFIYQTLIQVRTIAYLLRRYIMSRTSLIRTLRVLYL